MGIFDILFGTDDIENKQQDYGLFSFLNDEQNNNKSNNKDNNYMFLGFKLWNMPQTTIDTVIKDFWNITVNIIRNGVEYCI